MDLQQVMADLQRLGSAQTRKVHARHGAPEGMFGVKVGDMKTLVKQIKVDQNLASQLFATGNADAMYLAGLIADPSTITKAELDRWAKSATWHMVSECSVAWVAAESPHGWDRGAKWIEAKPDLVQSCGWATLGGVVAMRPDADLDLGAIEQLLERVAGKIHAAPNRTRYSMNGFVIGVGCYVIPLAKQAKKVAESIGVVSVEMGETSCQVPFAPQYIDKVAAAGRLGRKRKKVRC